MKLLNNVLEEIRPLAQEEQALKEAYSSFIKEISRGLRGAQAIIGGSAAKGTWLKGKFDVDIFVRYDYKRFAGKSGKLSALLKRHLEKRFGRVETLHGSRDYFNVKHRGHAFEVVPVLRISRPEQAKNIMDISPLHVAWVKKRVKGLENEVRLTKAFCIAKGIYGAESYIHGFSGYACEILTIYYGSFIGLARAASKWRAKQVIDPEGYFKGKDVIRHLNKSKTYGPLILIDPVQADRNVTAALSTEKFELFIRSAKAFLKKPSKSFFEKEEPTKESLMQKAKGKKLILVEAVASKGKDDVVGARLLKALDFIKKGLDENCFRVHEFCWSWDKKGKASYWFIVDRKDIGSESIVSGPPVSEECHVERFKKRHKNVFISKGRMYAKERRRFVKPERLVAALLKTPYFQEKVKGARCLCFT